MYPKTPSSFPKPSDPEFMRTFGMHLHELMEGLRKEHSEKEIADNLGIVMVSCPIDPATGRKGTGFAMFSGHMNVKRIIAISMHELIMARLKGVGVPVNEITYKEVLKDFMLEMVDDMVQVMGKSLSPDAEVDSIMNKSVINGEKQGE